MYNLAKQVTCENIKVLEALQFSCKYEHLDYSKRSLIIKQQSSNMYEDYNATNEIPSIIKTAASGHYTFYHYSSPDQTLRLCLVETRSFVVNKCII